MGAISGFGPSGVTCSLGYTGTVTYTVCGSAGTAYSVGGCTQLQDACTVPTTANYEFGSAAGTVTISGFGPSGVTCSSGYTGTVTYTVCGSAGTAYSVGGCTQTQAQASWLMGSGGQSCDDVCTQAGLVCDIHG